MFNYFQGMLHLLETIESSCVGLQFQHSAVQYYVPVMLHWRYFYYSDKSPFIK